MSIGFDNEARSSTVFHETGAEAQLSLRSGTDISSYSAKFEVPFGNAKLQFPMAPPKVRNLLWQLSELGTLEEDWNSYGALPVSFEPAFSCASLLIDIFDVRMPPPSIVPTSKGGIQIEWHREELDLEIEFEPNGEILMSFEDHRTGEEEECEIIDDYSPILKRLNRLICQK